MPPRVGVAEGWPRAARARGSTVFKRLRGLNLPCVRRVLVSLRCGDYSTKTRLQGERLLGAVPAVLYCSLVASLRSVPRTPHALDTRRHAACASLPRMAAQISKKEALMPALHEVNPREQVGSQTGAVYEYQYHQAAAGALSLINDARVVCVYCEWHDDYVCEVTSATGYNFHQVKTRQASQGAWTLKKFFGLPRAKGTPPLPCDLTSPFAHLWDHTVKFGGLCERFIFVTNGAVDANFSTLLDAARSVHSVDALAAEPRASFEFVKAAATPALNGVTDETLLNFLARLTIEDGVGAANDLPGCRVLIASRILEASEVDLLISEARKIGADLVAMVRDRSHRVLNTLPASADELRATKGIVLANLLSLLSLSPEGYRQLKVGGRESVVALSRLTRLCKRTNVPDAVIPKLCQFRTEYCAWWVDERDRIESVDALALRAASADLLRAHSAGGLSFEQLLEQAKGLAEQYAPKLTSSTPLTSDLVLGLIVDLAVETES
jgi:Cap4 dsDNA endonuclease